MVTHPITPESPPMTEHLLYDVRDNIGIVTINRPASRNAMLYPMYDRLAEICASLGDGPVKALILTGAGEQAFCAGTDISQFRTLRTPEDALAYDAHVDHILEVLETCKVPTIAAIAGACTGGGAGLAATCDMRIGMVNARFGFPIARTLGNCLSIDIYARLRDLLGAARVKDLLFTSRLLGAEEAHRIGLFSELLPDHAALMARAEELARHLAGQAPLTLRATKESLRRLRIAGQPEAAHDLVLMCYMSADFREGMDAFLNKRPAVWQGR